MSVARRSSLVPLLPYLIACSFCLLALSSVAQTAPTAATADNIPNLVPGNSPDLLLWATPIRRGALQADPRIMAAFLRPWLLSPRLFDLSQPTAMKSARTLPPAKTYSLTPDPLNWSPSSDSPDEDDYAYLPELKRPEHPNTAQRLAAMSETPRTIGRGVAAKYDVSRIGDREIGEGINFYSVEKEVALGRELSFEVEQSARLLSDPVVNEYVNRTGQILVQHSDCKVPFIIKVIDDDDVNAFALPGGFFYVNSGLILAADDEAELAGVMAHEIAHVCARHATRNLTKSQITQYASLPLMFFGGPVAFAIREVSSLALPLSFLKFGRDAEREADMLGIEYQYAAGYDPTAFVDFFEKLEVEQKEPHNFVARAFMTHPMTDDRVRRAESMLELLPDRDSYITDTSEFDQVRERLSRLTHGHMLNGARPRPTLRRRSGTQ